MQSIQTKFIPCTNLKPARIKAWCERGSITMGYHSIEPNGPNEDDRHVIVADALVAKFVAEDAKKYGTQKNPWSAPRVCGCLKDGTYCHTFLPIEQSGKRQELCPAGTLDAIQANHVLIALANESDAATVAKAVNWAMENPDRQLQGPKLALMVAALSRAVLTRSTANGQKARGGQ